MNDAPIGMFDSGIGGLTVMKAVMNRLPHESICYFGDNARGPYGPRDIAEIRRFALEIAAFLEGLGVKLIVIACNSATSAGLLEVQRSCRIPVLGVVEPSLCVWCALAGGSSRSGGTSALADQLGQTVDRRCSALFLGDQDAAQNGVGIGSVLAFVASLCFAGNHLGSGRIMRSAWLFVGGTASWYRNVNRWPRCLARRATNRAAFSSAMVA